MLRRPLAAALFLLSPLSFSVLSAEPIPLLLITGENNHDCKYTSAVHKATLEKTGRFTVDFTEKPAATLADAEGLKKYKAFVLDYNGKRWGEAAETNFLAAVKGGTGVAVIHAANNAFSGWVEYEKLVGDCWREGTGHGKFHRFDVTITDRDHPITKDLPDLKAHPDELYHKLVHMHGVERRVLATALSSKESNGTGNEEPMIIVLQYGQGRVFHTPLGHVWRNAEETKASVNDPQFQLLLARGTEWAATGECTIKSVGAGEAPAAACACKAGCSCAHCGSGGQKACGCGKKAEAPAAAACACKAGCSCAHCGSGGQKACGCGKKAEAPPAGEAAKACKCGAGCSCGHCKSGGQKPCSCG